MSYAQVIEQLVARRGTLKIAQAELARRLGITRTKMGYWETQRNRVSHEDLERWAGELGLVYVSRIEAPSSSPSLDAAAALLNDGQREAALTYVEMLTTASARDCDLIGGMVEKIVNEARESHGKKLGTG